MKFLFNAYTYTNPNTNPRTLTADILTINDRHNDFESFCALVFCDFIRNYFLLEFESFGLLDTSIFLRLPLYTSKFSMGTMHSLISTILSMAISTQKLPNH